MERLKAKPQLGNTLFTQADRVGKGLISATDVTMFSFCTVHTLSHTHTKRQKEKEIHYLILQWHEVLGSLTDR